MSTVLFEQTVLSKQYFDRHGLILAFDDEEPIGFVHAGFGPSEDFSSLSHDRGVICMLMVVPREDRNEVAQELINKSQSYLAEQGSNSIHAGGSYPLSPFYLGVYGGSELPGILISDKFQQEAFSTAGYVERGRCYLLQRNLSGFRAVVDRQQMQIRRRFTVEANLDPPIDHWWHACTIGNSMQTRFVLNERNGDLAGHATFWDMEPLASNWGVHAMGLSRLHVNEELRRQGLATFLVGESLRQLQANGITIAEVQINSDDEAAIALFQKLDFTLIDEGVSLVKEI